eukprot:CAMPEP_0173290806 /NCGR_PEP_ID=MMETSP1143-20121109/11772_1 /TAXON_ID=483371 /ORGANISM="non described non described, Strain CCMP2298" /LENGTH=54 /DNA_ID=CAMNT_0014229913 /DNA_START=111 /DNA_END=275 /DNA_ORIENTATION=-
MKSRKKLPSSTIAPCASVSTVANTSTALPSHVSSPPDMKITLRGLAMYIAVLPE